MDAETPLDRAVRLAGGVSALAKLLGESTQTVSNWRARGAAPANKCAAIEQHTGVNRRELRADDWRDYWPEMVGADSAPVVEGAQRAEADSAHEHPNNGEQAELEMARAKLGTPSDLTRDAPDEFPNGHRAHDADKPSSGPSRDTDKRSSERAA